MHWLLGFFAQGLGINDTHMPEQSTVTTRTNNTFFFSFFFPHEQYLGKVYEKKTDLDSIELFEDYAY